MKSRLLSIIFLFFISFYVNAQGSDQVEIDISMNFYGSCQSPIIPFGFYISSVTDCTILFNINSNSPYMDELDYSGVYPGIGYTIYLSKKKGGLYQADIVEEYHRPISQRKEEIQQADPLHTDMIVSIGALKREEHEIGDFFVNMTILSVSFSSPIYTTGTVTNGYLTCYWPNENNDVINNRINYISKNTVHPNPFIDMMNISLNAQSSIIIKDAVGKVVMTKELDKGNQQISVEYLPKGIYFLSIIQSNKKVVVHKILKQ